MGDTMRSFRLASLEVTTIGALTLAAGARAEGLGDHGRIKDGPHAAPLSWTGFYIGGHAGHASGNADWTFKDDTFFNTEAGETFSHDPTGPFGGGQFGFNRQVGHWVWGVEATLSGGVIRKMFERLIVPRFGVQIHTATY